jgi:iron complex transport system substrate-binding protein
MTTQNKTTIPARAPAHSRALALAAAIVAWILAASSAQAARAMRVVTDMAGRKVQVPVNIERVFSTSPPAQVLLYAIAPEKMIGWNMRLSDEARSYVAPSTQALPVLGGWMGNGATLGNMEVIGKERPDVMIQLSDVEHTWQPETARIQEQSGVPVIIVTGKLTEMDKACEFLGKLLGDEARAEKIAAYSRQTIAQTKATLATIPPAQRRRRVYYAVGASGLQTNPAGSVHVEVFDFLGAENVAKIPRLAGMP